MAESSVSSTTSNRRDDTKEIKLCISESLRVLHDSREVARFINREKVVSKDQIEEMLRIMLQMKNLSDKLDTLNTHILAKTYSSEESGSEPEYF